MPTDTWDFTILRGYDFQAILTYAIDGTVINLTTYSAVFKIISGTTTLLTLTDNDALTLASNGKCTIDITEAQIDDLPDGTHQMQLDIIDANNLPLPRLKGQVTVE